MNSILSRIATKNWPIFGGDGIGAIIARRLLAVVILFTLLDIIFVFATYVRDQEGLGQHLVSLEAAQIAKAVDIEGAAPHFASERYYGELIGSARMAFAVYDHQGREITVKGPWELAHAITPPITSVSSETRRDDHASGFRLRGIRRVIVAGQPLWVSMIIEGEGLRPFWPVIGNEMIDHVGLPLMPLALLLLALNFSAVRDALKPLSNAVHEVEALEPRQVERRLTVPASPREVRQLVSAMNKALARIESAIHALQEFTADAAHELRTPLAIMSMEIDGLPAGAAREKLRGDVDNMTRSVAQMLDMASADALQIPENATANLAGIATEVVTQLTPLAIQKGRTISFCDAGAATVHGHGEAIGRAVRNLVENALAHTPQGTSVDVIAGPGPLISVRDHGPGVPSEKRAAVLKRFWRGDRTRTSGSGLGLAIANRIAEAHGGHIEIDAAPGGGALVRLSFAPRADDGVPLVGSERGRNANRVGASAQRV